MGKQESNDGGPLFLGIAVAAISIGEFSGDGRAFVALALLFIAAGLS